MSARIERVDVVDRGDEVGPGDDAVFVAVRAAGETGWYGPTTAMVAERARSTLAPMITGMPVTDHRAVVRRFRTFVGKQISPSISWAIGVLDCAVWDLHGRIAGRPVCRLLGHEAPARTVPAYVSWLRLNVAETTSTEHVAQVTAQGLPLSKWGLRRELEGAARHEAERLAHVVDRTLGAASGPVAFDAVGTWNVEVACMFAKACQPFRALWVEDPLARHDSAAYERIAAAGLPVAVGERLRFDEDPAVVLGAASASAFTLDAVGCGGLTRAVDRVARARQLAVPVYPHGRSLQPAIHLAAAFPDVVAAVEYRLQWEPRRQCLYDRPQQVVHGRLSTPVSPGLATAPRRQSCPGP